jgi:hypothetical protein
MRIKTGRAEDTRKRVFNSILPGNPPPPLQLIFALEMEMLFFLGKKIDSFSNWRK